MHPDRKKHLLDLVEATFRSITAKLNLIFQEYLEANGALPLGDIITSVIMCIQLIYNYFFVFRCNGWYDIVNKNAHYLMCEGGVYYFIRHVRIGF